MFSSVEMPIVDETELIPPFASQLKRCGLFPLRATGIDILQINLGKMCNQTCNHCHVDAGPNRTEIMTRATMQACLAAIDKTAIQTIDLTGGAPEMNPHFKWFVTEIRKRHRHVIVRSNLTILTAKPYKDYPGFFKDNRLEVTSSLPCYTKKNTDAQRGHGVFEKSIRALRRLNKLGYGQPESGLILNLVYNPGGPSLPPKQETLEADYKRQLKQNFG
ncbi:MAG: radical SAM protein, partial [bacterium]